MNNTKDVAQYANYLVDFYGPSSRYFAVFVAALSIFIVFSNTLFFSLLISSRDLRSNPSNWLLGAFSLSDWLHGWSHFVEAIALWNGSVDNRYLCKIAGHFVVITGVVSFGFPPMIAAHRYYGINPDLGTGSYTSRLSKLFDDRGLPYLIIGWYITVVIFNMPLILNDSFGEDPSGYCLLKRFETPPLLIYYLATAINTVILSLTITGFYYYKLVKWLNKHQIRLQSNTRNLRRTNETYLVTKQLMRLMKFVSILPVFTSAPTATLTAGQMLLPVIPMWICRILDSTYMFTPCLTPWLTIFFIRPFRNRFRTVIHWRSSPVSSTNDPIHLSSQHGNVSSNQVPIK